MPERRAEAIRRFTQAHQLRPGAQTARAIGVLHHVRGEHLAAATWLERSLELRRDRLRPPQRANITSLLDELRGRLARLEVRTSQPAAVEVDGRRLEPRQLVYREAGSASLIVDWSDGDRGVFALNLPPGDRRVVVLAPGGGDGSLVPVRVDIATYGLLFVDGQLVSPARGTFYLSPGEHRLRVRWSGAGTYREETARFGPGPHLLRWTPQEFALTPVRTGLAQRRTSGARDSSSMGASRVGDGTD